MERVDIAIIGTGPAGVSAAITAKVRNKSLILFGSNDLSEKVSKAQEILNYPGLPSLSGTDFSMKLRGHMDDMGISAIEKRVSAVYPMGDFFGIHASDKMYEAKSVIIATGVVHGKPFPGENKFIGKGVSYCATCDAILYRDKIVAVIGFNEEAQNEAEFLTEFAKKVYYFPVGNKELELNKEIELINEFPMEISGNDKVEHLITDENKYDIDGVFILRDAVAPDQLVTGLNTIGNHVQVNLMMETNIKGLFACGDIAGKPYQYVKAAGQGNVAALSAVSYLSGIK